jgi:hypothetical protein
MPGRRKKQGLGFQDRHPNNNNNKEEKATKVDCLAYKAIMSS